MIVLKLRNEIRTRWRFFSKRLVFWNAALFGGLEYDLPKRGLRLKMEYDTSNPDFFKTVKRVDSRINLGVNYSFSDNFHISSSFERGSQFRFGF